MVILLILTCGISKGWFLVQNTQNHKSSFLLLTILTVLGFRSSNSAAITAEAWVASYGSFETGAFSESGSITNFGNFGGGFPPTTVNGVNYSGAESALFEGWNYSSYSSGFYSSLNPVSWIHDASLAKDGNRSVLLENRNQISTIDDGEILYVNESISDLSLLFGYPSELETAGPPLAEDQIYELSFWARTYGSNQLNQGITVNWLDFYSAPELSYQESRINVPLYPDDSEGNPLPLNLDNESVQWAQHRITFRSISGVGRLQLWQSVGIKFDGTESYSAVLIDDFRLMAVPEPSSVILILIGICLRPRRR